jgi:hypothetical protein
MLDVCSGDQPWHTRAARNNAPVRPGLRSPAFATSTALLNCRWPSLLWRYADAISIPHRTDSDAAEGAESGVRLLPSGLQRRGTTASRGLPVWCANLGHRCAAERDHACKDHARAQLAGRGAECGAGAIGQRCASGLAQFLPLSLGQAQGSQGGLAPNEVEEELSPVVSTHPKWIPAPSQWDLGNRQGRPGAGAMVAGTAKRTFERHDRSRAGWSLLRQLRCGIASDPAGGRRAGSRRRHGDHALGDNRRYERSTHRCVESKTSSTQVAEAAALTAPAVTSRERIKQQRQGATQDCHRAWSRCTRPAGLSPQTSFGADSRQPSDLRRRSQHRRNGEEQAIGTGDLRRRMGAVRSPHTREGRKAWSHSSCGLEVATIEQALQRVRTYARTAAIANSEVDMSGMSDTSRSRPQRSPSNSRRRAGGETKRLWSLSKSSNRGGIGR